LQFWKLKAKSSRQGLKLWRLVCLVVEDFVVGDLVGAHPKVIRLEENTF